MPSSRNFGSADPNKPSAWGDSLPPRQPVPADLVENPQLAHLASIKLSEQMAIKVQEEEAELDMHRYREAIRIRKERAKKEREKMEKELEIKLQGLSEEDREKYMVMLKEVLFPEAGDTGGEAMDGDEDAEVETTKYFEKHEEVIVYYDKLLQQLSKTLDEMQKAGSLVGAKVPK